MSENEVWEDMDWLYLTQDGDKWQAIADMVMNLTVPWNMIFLDQLRKY